MFIKGILY